MILFNLLNKLENPFSLPSETIDGKGENALFGVTKGSPDGAEFCELVGIYLLGQLSNIIDKENIGLYRDDGLSVIENANELKLNRWRKDAIPIFHNEGLKITIDTNLTTTDFLDVTLRSIHWKIVSI